jgi:hypothetical protein
MPDDPGSPVLGVHGPRHETKKTVWRQAQATKVTVTTHVEPDVRLFYKVSAAQFGMNMQDMQRVALVLVKARLESVPERARLAMWEGIQKEADRANEADV